MAKEDAPETLGKFNPGLGAQNFSLYESAKFVPKGSDLVFNLHYTSVGKAAKDRSRVGLVFAKQPPKLRYFMHNGPTAANLAILAREGNAEVVSEMTTTVDMKLVYMHLTCTSEERTTNSGWSIPPPRRKRFSKRNGISIADGL
jgi:hypothetical protein